MRPFKKKPEKPTYFYRFLPLPDLTAYELAQIWNISESAKYYDPGWANRKIEALPPEMMRHFRRENRS